MHQAYRMKNLQLYLHLIRKRAWKHKIALHHFDRAIPEMEKAYRHASLRSTSIIFAIHEIKMLRIEEYFEYREIKAILKSRTLFTA